MHNQNRDTKPTQQVASWVKFSQAGVQLLVTVLLLGGVGYYIDGEMANSVPGFTIAGSLLGIIAGLYSVVKQFIRR